MKTYLKLFVAYSVFIFIGIPEIIIRAFMQAYKHLYIKRDLRAAYRKFQNTSVNYIKNN